MTKLETKPGASQAQSPSVASSSRLLLKNKSRVKRMQITSKRQTMMNDDSRIVSDKYMNVSYNRVTGRWQAWTNCMATSRVSRGPYVGEHATENLAARAQDRSLLKHRALATKLPIKLNFPEADYAPDEKLRNALTNEEFLKLLALESRACYRKVEATKCLQIFMAEEEALGNLPVEPERKTKRVYKVMPLRDYLKRVLMDRPEELTDLPAALDKPVSEKPVPLAQVAAPSAEVSASAPVEAANAPVHFANPGAAALTWVGKRARSHVWISLSPGRVVRVVQLDFHESFE